MILHVDSIIKSFSKEQILADIFLKVTKGEIIGLLGRNGCGKSVLMKIIHGSMQAEAKFVKVGSKVINNLCDTYGIINYLPQTAFIPKHISCAKVINLYCNNKSLLDVAKIKLLLNKQINQMSVGESRFFEVMLLVYSNSHFTLLDEPFSGISPIDKDIIKNSIVSQSKRKGFIITDHDYNTVLEISNRFYVLSRSILKEVKNKEDIIKLSYLPEM